MIRHVVIPGLPTFALVALYFVPVSLVGCVNLGLIALGVVLVAISRTGCPRS